VNKWLNKEFIAVGMICLALHSNAQVQPCPSSLSGGTSCIIGGIEFIAIPGGEFAMGVRSGVAQPSRLPRVSSGDGNEPYPVEGRTCELANTACTGSVKVLKMKNKC